MKSRLAFSIASLVQPDILILDEVLSVGDGAFQKKSQDKILELLRSGVTTIFVNHSLGSVRSICNKALWMEHDKQIAFGDTQRVTAVYERFLDKELSLEEAKQLFTEQDADAC